MLAAGLTGVKLGVQVAHVEARLRSYDWRMPEEHNRRMVDHVSDLLRNLMNERVYGKIFVRGNTVIDAVDHYLPLALESSSIMEYVPFSEFCYVTIHRQENFDSPETLRELVATLMEIEVPMVFSLHPRTNMRLREFGLYEKLASSPRLHLPPPVGYLTA